MKIVKIFIKRYLYLAVFFSLALNLVFIIKFVKNKLQTISYEEVVNKASDSTAQKAELFNQINPEQGYELKIAYGNLGPKLLDVGVIDLEKFKKVYQSSGQPLTQEELDILTEGSGKNVKITRENSYFLLNFFWAVGLANNSRILTDGNMTKDNQTANFASTGGWTLGKKGSMDYYSKSNLILLNKDQESLVEKVSSNIYRPCCDNPTSFPDCNHGMALLGILELMASSGATENQMYEAAKYFNSFWFPSNYYDLALYFKNKEGKDFSQVPGEIILDKDYSSASGWQSVKKWLTDKGIVEQPSQKQSSCGT